MLVSIVAKSARHLVGQDELLNNQKAVSYAVNELNNDELEITYPEEQKSIPLKSATKAGALLL